MNDKHTGYDLDDFPKIIDFEKPKPKQGWTDTTPLSEIEELKYHIARLYGEIESLKINLNELRNSYRKHLRGESEVSK